MPFVPVRFAPMVIVPPGSVDWKLIRPAVAAPVVDRLPAAPTKNVPLTEDAPIVMSSFSVIVTLPVVLAVRVPAFVPTFMFPDVDASDTVGATIAGNRTIDTLPEI